MRKLIVLVLLLTACSTTVHERVEHHACIERKVARVFGLPLNTTESHHDLRYCRP